MTEQTWHRVASLSDLPEGEMAAVTAGSAPVALYRVEGRVHATSNVCTHGRARLTDGYLEGHLVECPLHQGQFDVRTGAPQGLPVTRPLKVHEVRIEGDDVYVLA